MAEATQRSREKPGGEGGTPPPKGGEEEGWRGVAHLVERDITDFQWPLPRGRSRLCECLDAGQDKGSFPL